MPKEVIYRDAPAPAGEPEPFLPVVTWHPQGWVQVSVRSGPDDLNHVSPAADLSRHQINVLIRHLRRARDRAFGADA